MDIKEIAAVVAGVGALNWALAEFGFNLLSFLGSYSNIGAYVVGASGAFVLYEMFA